MLLLLKANRGVAVNLLSIYCVFSNLCASVGQVWVIQMKRKEKEKIKHPLGVGKCCSSGVPT